METWVTLCLVTFVYLEWIRSRKLKETSLKKKERAWWQPQRTYGLALADRQEAELRELKLLADKVESPTGRKALAKQLRKSHPRTSGLLDGRGEIHGVLGSRKLSAVTGTAPAATRSFTACRKCNRLNSPLSRMTIVSCLSGVGDCSNKSLSFISREVVVAYTPGPLAFEHILQRVADDRQTPGLLLEFSERVAQGSKFPWQTGLDMRIGEAGAPGDYDASFMRQRLELQFDGLMFLKETTPITVLQGYYQHANEKWQERNRGGGNQ